MSLKICVVLERQREESIEETVDVLWSSSQEVLMFEYVECLSEVPVCTTTASQVYLCRIVSSMAAKCSLISSCRVVSNRHDSSSH